MTRAGSTGKKLEGEGSYSATRGYNQKLARHIQENDVSKLADKARRALEGPERATLQRAEKVGRKGPRTGSAKR